jgi:hypothetical protein
MKASKEQVKNVILFFAKTFENDIVENINLHEPGTDDK